MNDAEDFDSAAGSVWTVARTPFPWLRANAGSRPRGGWELGARVEEEIVHFLAPSVPANVLGMAHNTRPRRPRPSAGRPSTRRRPAWSVRATPSNSSQTWAALSRRRELTVVIGSKARGLTPDNASDGHSGLHDRKRRLLPVTCRTPMSCGSALRARTRSRLRGPGSSRTCRSRTSRSASSTTACHSGRPVPPISVWKVEEILAYLTSFMTLHPGDLVLTGFPAQTVPIAAGGHRQLPTSPGSVELTNPVIAGQALAGPCPHSVAPRHYDG